MGKAPLSRALREIKQLLCVQSLILYYMKQIDSMLPCICPVIDHRGRQNVVRTSVTHSAIASCATFLFLPHFDVICDLLQDRCTATWNLFVNLTTFANTSKFVKNTPPRVVFSTLFSVFRNAIIHGLSCLIYY